MKLEDGEHLDELDPLRRHTETPAGRQIFISFLQSAFCPRGQISIRIADASSAYAPDLFNYAYFPLLNAELELTILDGINRSEMFDISLR